MTTTHTYTGFDYKLVYAALAEYRNDLYKQLKVLPVNYPYAKDEAEPLLEEKIKQVEHHMQLCNLALSGTQGELQLFINERLN